MRFSKNEMQASAKMTMNVDNKAFMDVQKNLLDQNTENGFMFSDMKNYLSNMSSYSMKNYTQAQALYKQVTLGTRYLGLSTQNINSLVKATNALADDRYATRQMAILSSLATDNTTMEDLNSISEFMSTNIEGVSARYGNGEKIVKDSVAVKDAADKLFGSKSNLVTQMMSEIMNTSDFSNLSSQTQELLAMTGNAQSTWAQMRSGSLSMPQLIEMLMSGVSNRANDWHGRAIMEQNGLGDWVTLSNAYNNNRDEFYKNVESNLNKLANVTGDNAEEIEENLKVQNENKTWFEKFGNNVMKELHLQNVNWQDLNGFLQVLNAMYKGTILVLDTARNIHLVGIKHAIQNQNLSLAGKDNNGVNKLSGGSSNGSLFNNLFKKGGNLTAGQRLGLGAAGLSRGLYDASAMSEKDGELDAGDLRGFFMGQSASNKSTTHNMISNGANVLKWTAMGAAVGGPWGAAGGAVVGSILSIIGTFMEDNTEAVEDNTKQVKISNDRLQSNSGISQYYSSNGVDNSPKGTAAPGYGGVYPIKGKTGSYVPGKGGERKHPAGNPYPYSVTSDYGWRWLKGNFNGTYINKKEWHTGIDFGMPEGTPIGSACDGTIVDIGNRGKASGGIITLVRSKANPGLLYRYFHQSKSPAGLKIGDEVKAGDIIGYVGHTGYASGPHLHFQVDDGSYSNNYDPNQFVTNAIFKPTGKSYSSNPSLEGSNSTSVADGALSAAMSSLNTPDGVSLTGNSSIKLNKESLFGVGTASDYSGASSSPSMPNDYATSKDIDRLIEAMQTLNDEQRDNREFMMALAGKNSYTFSAR